MKGVARAWPADRVALLGTVPDAKLAEAWGIPQNSVAVARIRRKIPAHQPQKPWTASQVALLGTMPDSAVAQLVGRSKGAVAAARRDRRIRGFKPGTL